MPFTVSHAVAVLPLTHGRVGATLVPAALVLGSMAPDLPYFVPLGDAPLRWVARWTHAASGPVTIDLVLGLVVFAVWQLVLRRPVVALGPDWLRTRLPAAPPLTARRWGWAAVSVVVGATTHVVWDDFTHPRRWATTHVHVLQEMAAGLPLYSWLQYASGALGLAGLTLWAWRWGRRTPPGPAVDPPRMPRRRVWTGLVIVAVVAGVVFSAYALRSAADLEAAAFQAVTATMATAALAAAVVCLWWHVRGRLTD